jgi:nucleoside-diphosphate-sugar epimerase
VITINDLVSMIEEILGKKALRQYIPAHPADVYSNVADVTKARQMLGWEPRVGLREGVRSLVDWYLENRSWAKDIITD